MPPLLAGLSPDPAMCKHFWPKFTATLTWPVRLKSCHTLSIHTGRACLLTDSFTIYFLITELFMSSDLARVFRKCQCSGPFFLKCMFKAVVKKSSSPPHPAQSSHAQICGTYELTDMAWMAPFPFHFHVAQNATCALCQRFCCSPHVHTPVPCHNDIPDAHTPDLNDWSRHHVGVKF